MRTYLLKWGEGLASEARACAKNRGITLAQWLREAASAQVMRDLRQDYVPSDLELRAERAAASLHDRARHLAAAGPPSPPEPDEED